MIMSLLGDTESLEDNDEESSDDEEDDDDDDERSTGMPQAGDDRYAAVNIRES